MGERNQGLLIHICAVDKCRAARHNEKSIISGNQQDAAIMESRDASIRSSESIKKPSRWIRRASKCARVEVKWITRKSILQFFFLWEWGSGLVLK